MKKRSGRASAEARARANEALVARRRAEGWRWLSIWLPPASVEAIASDAKRAGKSFTGAAKGALESYYGIDADSGDDT